MKKFFVLFALVFLTFGCGNSQNSGHAIPAKWLKYLSQGTWRADIIVLDSENRLQHREPATINQETGDVQSSQFSLKDGSDYRFLVVFYYKLDDLELPVGLVLKFSNATREIRSLTWEAREIYVLNKDIPVDDLKKVPAEYIPNLDQDNDGVSNVHEMIAGSDPLDAASLPPPPKVVQDLKINKALNDLDFEITFEDPLGVRIVRPSGNYGCGHHDWTFENLSGDGTTVKLHGYYNLHAHQFDLNELLVQLEAENELGFRKTYDFPNIAFQKDGAPKRWGPEIWIKNPEPNSTVSDEFFVDAEACDEDGILSLAPQDIGDTVDLQEVSELFSGNISTELLTENATELTFAAQAIASNANRDTYHQILRVPLIVQANNEINVFPAPGQILKDNFNISAEVDTVKIPDFVKLEIESLSSSNPDWDGDFSPLTDVDHYGAAGIAGIEGHMSNTAFADENSLLTVTYKATTRSRIIRRQVTYRVYPMPIISNFAMLNSDHSLNPCIADGNAKLTWKVDSWDLPKIHAKTSIRLNSVDQKSENGTAWLGMVTESNAVSFRCEPKIFNIEDGSQSKMTLSATRVGLDDKGSTGQEFTSTAKLAYMPVIANGLPNNVYVSHVQPIHITLMPYFGLSQPDALNGLRWKVSLNQIFDDGMPLPVKLSDKPDQSLEGQGLDIAVNNPELLPRAHYQLNLNLLNHEGKVFSSKTGDFYTFGDDGLVAWWRFNDPNFAPNSDNLLAIPNFYGNFNDLVGEEKTNGTANFEWDPFVNENQLQVTQGLKFLKTSSSISENPLDESKILLVGGSGFSFEVLVKFDEAPAVDNPYAFVKRGDFALGYTQDGNFLVTLGFAGCEDVKAKGFYTANDGVGIIWKTGKSIGMGHWHHVVITYGQIAIDTYKLNMYIDGINVAGPNSTKKLENKSCNSKFTINYADLDFGYQAIPFTVGEMAYYYGPLAPERTQEICENVYPTPEICKP